jgi:cytoskeletal protein CcmA (bactofilin family)
MARNNDAPTNVRVNSIVEGTVIRGEVTAPGNFRIDGTVEGNMKIEGRLIIGSKGKVEGDVICKDADIEGFFNGNIKVNGLLALKSSSRIEGDAMFQRLMVEEGATLKCTCNIKDGVASTVTHEKDNLDSLREMESLKAL